MSRTSSDAAARERRAIVGSIAVGVGVLLAVAIGGALTVLTRPTSVVASASIVVLPDERLSEESIAGYYETLTRGQVVATYAEILRDRPFPEEAMDDLGIAASRQDEVDVDVRVVPDTALVEVAVTAPTEEVAQKVADSVTALAADYLQGLEQPYTAEIVAEAGEARSTGTPLVTLLAVIALVAVVAGLGAQQLVFQVGTLLGRRRGTRGVDVAPAPGTPAP